MLTLPFGFLPYEEEYDIGDVQIRMSPQFSDCIAAVEQTARINDGWFYPPLESQRPRSPAIGLGIQVVEGNPVEVETSWFQLPYTHVLTHAKSRSLDRGRFLVIAFGFVLGMRLLPEGFGHLFKTPVRRSMFGDFIARDRGVVEAMSLFDEFYQRHPRGLSRALIGIVNSLQWGLSQPYNHVRFTHLYMAVDGCAALFKRTHGLGWRSSNSHASLPRDLCVAAGIPVPKRGRTYRLSRPNGRLACTYSQIRNALVHEALSEGMPTGFAGNMPMHESSVDLEGLVYRLVYYLIGCRRDSLKSAIDDRMTKFL